MESNEMASNRPTVLENAKGYWSVDPKTIDSVLSVDIVPNFADIFGRCHEDVPKRLVGSKIVRFGILSINGNNYPEAHLAIDFIPEHETTIRRIILGFNELGMWVGCQSDAESISKMVVGSR